MDGQGPQRAIAALLSFSLATGCLPITALAVDEGADVAVTEEVSAEVSVPEAAALGIDSEPLAEPELVAEPDPEPEIEWSNEVEVAPGEGATDPQSEPEAAADAEPAYAEVAKQDVPTVEREASAAAPAQEDTTQTAAQSSLAQVARLVIHDKQDESKPKPIDPTTLKAGDTLWARAFDKDGKVVSLDGNKVTYRWLVADKPSSSTEDFAEVIGTEESLKLSPDLAGRYLIVEVSEGTTKAYGPLSESKKGEAAKLEPLVLPESLEQPEAAPTDRETSAATEQAKQEAPALSAQAVTTAKTPSSDVREAWSTATAPSASTPAASLTTAVSAPLVVDGQLVVFSYADVLVLSPVTGKVVTSYKDALPEAIATPCEPLLHNGVIYVPLCNSSIVALDAADPSKSSFLRERWTSEALTDSNAAACSLSVVVHFGKTYLLVGASKDAAAGAFATLDAATGKQVTNSQSSTAGYGEAASLMHEGIVYVGDSSGVLHAVSPSTGKDISCLALSTSAICGKIVACGDALLVADRAGTLHKVTASKDGSLTETGSVRIGNGCASAPVVVGQVAVCGVCGPSGKEASEGALVIVDVSQMRVTKKVTLADGAPLAKGGVTAEPLVSVGSPETWCYFAVDGPAGTVYAYRLGDAQATELFVPTGKKADRCDHPLVADTDGSIYYLNASGQLSKLVAVPASIPHTPVAPSPTTPKTPTGQSSVRPGNTATPSSSNETHQAAAAHGAQVRAEQARGHAETMAHISEAQRMGQQSMALRDEARIDAPGGAGSPHAEDLSLLERLGGAPEGAQGHAHSSEGGPAFSPDAAMPFVAGGDAFTGEIAQVDAQAVTAVSQNNKLMNAVKALAVALLGLVTYVTLRHKDEPQQ